MKIKVWQQCSISSLIGLFFMIWLFLFSGLAWSLNEPCSSRVAPQEAPLSVTRFALLDVEGHRPVWMQSRLDLSAKRRLWRFDPSFFEAEALASPFGPRWMGAYSPEVRSSAEAVDTTLYRSRRPFQFVYDLYQEQVARRTVFDPQFIEDLRAEDRFRREQDLSVWMVEDEKQKEIHAVWGLYIHERSPSLKVEFIRLGKLKRSPFRLEQALRLTSEYLMARGLRSGMVEMRSDAVGSAYYQRLGAHLDSKYGEGKFLLKISIEEWMSKFPPLEIENGSRSLGWRSVFGEPVFF